MTKSNDLRKKIIQYFTDYRFYPKEEMANQILLYYNGFFDLLSSELDRQRDSLRKKVKELILEAEVLVVAAPPVLGRR